jgi:hypothetical protein
MIEVVFLIPAPLLIEFKRLFVNNITFTQNHSLQKTLSSQNS